MNFIDHDFYFFTESVRVITDLSNKNYEYSIHNKKATAVGDFLGCDI